MKEKISNYFLSTKSCFLISFLILSLFYVSHPYKLLETSKSNFIEITSAKCMIQNCIQCQENLPYTCKTCQKDKNCCSPYCQNCTSSNQTICVQCQKGYIFNSTSKTCVLQNSCSQAFCSDCKAPQNKCQACNLGYILNPFTLTCVLCPEGCEQCNQTLDCFGCISHWYMKDQVCLQCDSICQNCEYISTRCTDCPLQWYWQNYTCYKCLQHCLQCNQPDFCNSCEKGHYFDNNTKKCQLCGQYCEICNSVTECIRCEMNYYMNEKTKFCETCDEVIPKCQECLNQGFEVLTLQRKEQQILKGVQCVKCQPNYILQNQTICKPCIEYCVTCLTPIDCSVCQIGYFYDVATKKCLKCTVINCLNCKTQKQCQVCNQGYFWNNITHPDYSFCEKCRIGCLSCGINYCITCDKGYYFSNNTCLKCSSQCIQCAENSTHCIICGIGYFMAQNALRCAKCSQNCLRCTTRDICTDCAIGYRNENKSCIKCQIQNCGYCQKNNNSDQKCLECIQAYFLRNNSCSSCIKGCLTCPQENKCFQCFQHYYFQASTQTCQSCPNNCITCQPTIYQHDDCLECEPGYYLDEKYQCKACQISNCSTCSIDGCTRCNSGFYFFLDNRKCNPCSQNCFQCFDDSTCIQCSQGLYLENFKCLKCPKGCEICSSLNNCVICSSGFMLDKASNTCHSCNISNCALCITGINTCIQCYPGYILEKLTQIAKENEHVETSLCFKCGQNIVSGCRSCVSSKECSECIDGYLLNEHNLCEVETYKIWVYVLVICILSGIILLIAGLRIREMKREGQSIRQIFKFSKKTKDPQNYHKLQQLSIH